MTLTAPRLAVTAETREVVISQACAPRTLAELVASTVVASGPSAGLPTSTTILPKVPLPPIPLHAALDLRPLRLEAADELRRLRNVLARPPFCWPRDSAVHSVRVCAGQDCCDSTSAAAAPTGVGRERVQRLSDEHRLHQVMASLGQRATGRTCGLRATMHRFWESCSSVHCRSASRIPGLASAHSNVRPQFPYVEGRKQEFFAAAGAHVRQVTAHDTQSAFISQHGRAAAAAAQHFMSFSSSNRKGSSGVKLAASELS